MVHVMLDLLHIDEWVGCGLCVSFASPPSHFVGASSELMDGCLYYSTLYYEHSTLLLVLTAAAVIRNRLVPLM